MSRQTAAEDTTAVVPIANVAAPGPTDATDALGRQGTTTTKRRRDGPSARKRKQARAEMAAPAPVNDDGSVDEMVDAVPGEGHDRSASEVSEDESDVAPRIPTSPYGSPLVIATKDDGGVADNGDDDDMDALGSLNHDPLSVGSIFSRRAAAERLSGLDVAARVWSTTTQLLGDSPAAHKLAWATAASNDRAYLVVMGANTSFTLVHHFTIMDVELRPRDPILGRLVAFEADMRDGAPPGWWCLMGSPQIFSDCSAPN